MQHFDLGNEVSYCELRECKFLLLLLSCRFIHQNEALSEVVLFEIDFLSSWCSFNCEAYRLARQGHRNIDPILVDALYY